MRTFWMVQAGIGAVAIVASAALGVACGGSSTGPDSGTDFVRETGSGTGISCHDCACVQKSGDTPPGCADVCDRTISGESAPDFCNGSPALDSCKACIAYWCGVSKPPECT